MKTNTSISKFMQALMDFEAYIVEDDFIEIFGKENAPALWQDFKNKCANNTTIFYRTLSIQERQQFDAYLAKSNWLKP